MLSLYLKAYLMEGEKVVREGMSVGESRVRDKTLQSDGTRIAECPTAIPFSSE